ncbi:MAG: DUF3613 domain-containing protein [Gammaproteobacteria bacterium]|nr:MAG: DUF3613 domain-containing protein [Gammaproteobacteria bacterium]
MIATQSGVVFADQNAVATAYPLENAGKPVAQAGNAGIGARTEAWLNAQSSGRLASPNLQRATLEERELANQRLLDSYRHPIPDFFDEDIGGKLDE